MRKATAGLLALAATAAFAGTAEAQIPNLTPFAVEVHGGAAFPMGDLKDLGEASTGYTFGAKVTAHVLPVGGIYAGYSVSQFGTDATDGEEFDLTTEGFSVGVRVGVPTPLIPIDPWVSAGAVFHDLKSELDGVTATVDGNVGFEVGGGIAFNILPKVQVVPQAHYSRFTLDAGEGDDDDGRAVEQLRAEVGVRIRI